MVLSSASQVKSDRLSITQHLNELQMNLHASEKQCLELQQKISDADREVKQARAGMASLTALAGRKMMLFERSMLILRAAACHHGYPSVDLYIKAMSKKSSFQSSADIAKFDDERPFCRTVSPFTRQVSPETGEPEPLSADEAWLDECLLRLGDNWAVTMAGADPDAPAEPLVKEAGVQVDSSVLGVNQETQTDTSGDSGSGDVMMMMTRQVSNASCRSRRMTGGLFSLVSSISGRAKAGSLNDSFIEESEERDNAASRSSFFGGRKSVSARQRLRASVGVTQRLEPDASEMSSPILEKEAGSLNDSFIEESEERDNAASRSSFFGGRKSVSARQRLRASVGVTQRLEPDASEMSPPILEKEAGSLNDSFIEESEERDNAASRSSFFGGRKSVSARQRLTASVAVTQRLEPDASEMSSPILEKASSRFLGQIAHRHSIGSSDADRPRSPFSAQPKLPPGNSSNMATSADDKKPQLPAVPQPSHSSPRRNSMAAMMRANLALQSGGGPKELKKDAPLDEIIRQQRIRRASLSSAQGSPGDISST
eukprot:TRINITY_DN10039_c0_g1_i2.p1 TRINITY_DN10039_c0_g1~~TRINITY_DN10039_c0_g1_i2.p1  ORF type:complete len:543 (+),score=80.90 TRINITY_DN10039_c0_g1_i2:97-1725(+)